MLFRRTKADKPLPPPTVKPSELVLEYVKEGDTREHLQRMLIDVLDEVFMPMVPEQHSNGAACDTILRLLDLAIVRPEQRRKLYNHLERTLR